MEPIEDICEDVTGDIAVEDEHQIGGETDNDCVQVELV